MADAQYDLVVVGAGIGGYVGAIRAAQLGFKVAIVEKDKSLGGTCLNVGCIPSKAMLESSHRYAEAVHGLGIHGIKVGGVELDLPTMLSRKDQVVTGLTKNIPMLLQKNKIDVVKGTGTIPAVGRVEVTLSEGGTRTLETRRIMVATGSVPATLKGVTMDEDRIVSSTGALAFTTVPKHLVIIGAGVIGLELGSVWSRLGAKVTVLEYLDRILAGTDREIAASALRIFQGQGMTFRLSRRVLSAKVNGATVVVEHADAAGAVELLECDRVLVATGRRPFTDGLGLEALGVKLDKRGCIEIDKHWQTNVPGIFAVGDCVPGAMLAHKAEDEGVAAAEFMATGVGHVKYEAIPNVVYTNPEVASVGRTEEELKDAGIPYKKGSFPFKGNGRARALASTDGVVKILAHAQTDRILGAHILGPSAGDLIAELAVAMELESSAEDIARSSHAHPTLSEVIKEAALAVAGRAIHI